MTKTKKNNTSRLTETKTWTEKASWEEFRQTGLLFFINQILHVFGYAIGVEMEDGSITKAYPLKTKYRGFGKESIDRGYKKIAKYMKENSNNLYHEAYEDEDEDENKE